MPSLHAQPPHFGGFARPEQNWFRMPNNWTDITAEITSLAELKLVEYVLKHTWGYQEYEITKHITLDEFMSGRRRKDGSRIDKGTGLSKPSVIAGLKAAVEHGYLRVEVDGSDKARVKKFYRLRMAGEGVQSPAEAESPPPIPTPSPEESSPEAQGEGEGLSSFTSDVKNLYPDVKNVYRSGKESLQRSEKDNLVRQQQKDNKSNNTRATLPDPDVVVVLSRFGIAQKVAAQLAREYPADRIAHKVEYLEFLQEERPSEVKKPAAWLRRAIESDFAAPDGFVSGADRQRHQSEQKRRKQADSEALAAQREAIAAHEKARADARRQWREDLSAQYGTSDEARQAWTQALVDLRHQMGLAGYSLVADAEALKLQDGTLTLGIPHPSKLRDLQHPSDRKRIERAVQGVIHRPVTLELVAIAGPPDG